MISDPRDFSTFIPSQDAFASEGRLVQAVAEYLQPRDVAHVRRALECLHEVRLRQMTLPTPPAAASRGERDGRAEGDGRSEKDGRGKKDWRSDEAAHPPLAQPGDLARAIEYAISVSVTLAETLHLDAVTIGAVLLYQLVEARLLNADDVRARLGGGFGEQVARTIESIERFDTLQRPAAALRRSAQSSVESEEGSRERRRSRERQRQLDADALRKMFMAMAEDPRVVVIKIADQLRLMRRVSEAADIWRAREGAPTAREVVPEARETTPRWSLADCRMLAGETRDVFAPLAARLGMSRVESELEDLAFAVLEPEEYRWLSEAVARESLERGSYVEQVTEILREEMRRIGIQAEVSGRIKHLYSIYKKVRRTGTRDLSSLYDILAFRIIVNTIEECYLALGHVHDLWRPKDGRIKDFIASPKPNGYQSLHTTVFCLNDRLAEVQIRTRAMHEMAEFGVAMHWYYKDVGDSAKAKAKSLQSWVRQVKEWQQEWAVVGGSGAPAGADVLQGDGLREQIYVFTPAGDAKELPAGATPLDFAYRVHTDLGNHVAGVRITADDGTGKLVKKLVPLDYELRSGDVIEIIKRNDAHPTRDWLRVARTKLAHGRIQKYLNSQEREQHLALGRERLDRELRGLGLRKGFEDLASDVLEWLAQEVGYSQGEGLLVALGNEKVRIGTLLPRLRDRLRIPAPPEPAADEPPPVVPERETQPEADVEGMSGMLTNLAHCCDPLPGDELMGFISRGRGVMIHRADCPNLRHLLAKEPGRAVAVGWPKLDGKEHFRAPVVVEGNDRTGFLRDVTGVITGHKLNMLKVEVVTKHSQGRAVVNAILEIQTRDDLENVLRDLRNVPSVISAERKQPNSTR
jgi:GTP pyrophosphokinase